MASTHIDYRKIDYDQLIDKPITRVASGVNPNTLTTAGVYDRGDGNRFIVTVDGQNILQVIEKKDGYETRSSTDGGTTWSTWDTVQYSDASHKWDVVIISATEPVEKRETTAWIDTAHDNTLKVYDGTVWMTVSGQSIQIATMPTASSALMGKVFQFIGTTDSNYTHGYFYEVAEDSGTYSWTEVKTQSVDAESVTYDNTTSGLTATNVQDAIDEMNTVVEEIKDIVEVETMPSPSEESEGTIIQYKGATTSTFTHGYFYECVGDGQDPETFSRVNIQVQDNPSQAEVMPTPSAENVGQIVQYMGTSNASFTHGYFYESVSDGETPATYSWVNVEVQDYEKDIFLTQAQYDALPAADKANTKRHYYIYTTTGSGPVIGGDDVGYDNTTSGLIATTVQDAIDEIADKPTSLVDLEDTTITSPTNGQVLKYNSTTQKWENGNDLGGIQYNTNSPYKPGYFRVGTQAQYDALQQYYTEQENDTIFFTV